MTSVRVTSSASVKAPPEHSMTVCGRRIVLRPGKHRRSHRPVATHLHAADSCVARTHQTYTGYCCGYIMPKQRRSMACQQCKRLKTRCDLPPDTVTCLRCKNLRYVLSNSSLLRVDTRLTSIRLECVMPPSMICKARASSSTVSPVSRDGHQPDRSCSERQVYSCTFIGL